MLGLISRGRVQAARAAAGLVLNGIAALVAAPAIAAEGAASNYFPGTSDFGMGMWAPGGALQVQAIHYDGSASAAVRQGRVEFGVDLALSGTLLKGFYFTDATLLGGRYGLGIAVPIMHGTADVGLEAIGRRATISGDRFGLGDIYLVPAMLGWQQGNFWWMVYQGVLAPTADYDVTKLVNLGRNQWSFDTNVAFTWLDPKLGTEISLTAGFMWNTENSKTDYKTGNEFHLDYLLGYHFSPQWRAGVNGYWYQQLTGDSGEGARLGSFKGRAFGIGPAIGFSTTIGETPVNFSAKWLHEFETENRFKGDYFYLSGALSF